MRETNSDGIIVTDLFSKYTNIKYNTQYVVLDINQVHILGSPADIDGFKKYMSTIKYDTSGIDTPNDPTM
jgi:hypothetical protein